MIDLHPPLASFPGVLVSVVVFLEVLDLAIQRVPALKRLYEFFHPQHAVRILLPLAAIFTGLSFFSGYNASEHANLSFIVPDAPLSWHHTLGRASLLLFIPTIIIWGISLFPNQMPRLFRTVYGVLLVLLWGTLLVTGYLGGELIFRHGAGVSAEVPKISEDASHP